MVWVLDGYVGSGMQELSMKRFRGVGQRGRRVGVSVGGAICKDG